MYTRFSGKRQKNKMEINKRKFYRQVFALVIPMALQNLINVGVTAADVLMLGRVSEKVLSGASLAGQIQFVMTLILFGTTSGATVLTAQYWGKKDTQTIEKILGMGMTIGVSCAALFTIVAEIIPEVLLRRRCEIFADRGAFLCSDGGNAGLSLHYAEYRAGCDRNGCLQRVTNL